MNLLNWSGTSPFTILLKNCANAVACLLPSGSDSLILLAVLMYISNESQCTPVALPRLRCERVWSTCLGVKRSLFRVPPLLVDFVALTPPRRRDLGCRFCSTWRLESLIRATGACLVMRAFAVLKLSKSAASWAERWTVCCSGAGVLAWRGRSLS